MWLSTPGGKDYLISVILVCTQKAKKVLGYQVAKYFLRFLSVSRQNTESGISGQRKFLATFKSVSPKYALSFLQKSFGQADVGDCDPPSL